jgi:hypothetical protein
VLATRSMIITSELSNDFDSSWAAVHRDDHSLRGSLVWWAVLLVGSGPYWRKKGRHA